MNTWRLVKGGRATADGPHLVPLASETLHTNGRTRPEHLSVAAGPGWALRANSGPMHLGEFSVSDAGTGVFLLEHRGKQCRHAARTDQVRRDRASRGVRPVQKLSEIESRRLRLGISEARQGADMRRFLQPAPAHGLCRPCAGAGIRAEIRAGQRSITKEQYHRATVDRRGGLGLPNARQDLAKPCTSDTRRSRAIRDTACVRSDAVQVRCFTTSRHRQSARLAPRAQLVRHL